jgi:hypothetical protein
VPVRDVKSWPDFGGPQVAGSALEALGDVQVSLFALIPAQSVDTLRMHAGIGRPSEANSWNLAHIGDHRRIHMILLDSAAFVVVHLVCCAWWVLCAGSLGGSGWCFITYLSGAFMMMSRHRSRDDARRRREGQTTSSVKERATGRLLQK